MTVLFHLIDILLRLYFVIDLIQRSIKDTLFIYSFKRNHARGYHNVKFAIQFSYDLPVAVGGWRAAHSCVCAAGNSS